MKRIYDILKAMATKVGVVGDITGNVNGGSHDAVSVAGDGEFYKLHEFTLKPGLYIVKATGRFSANATGTRLINISDFSASAGNVVWNTAKQNASATNNTYVHLITFMKVSTEETFYINAAQNSGKALNVTPRFGAIRIE